MTSHNKLKQFRRKRIKRRIRGKISGTADRPRLNIFKSSKHIYVNFVDDEKRQTLFTVSTKSKDLHDQIDGKTGIEKAGIVGKYAAEKAAEAGIKKVVFDRGGYKYHGKIKALADAARKGGLQF